MQEHSTALLGQPQWPLKEASGGEMEEKHKDVGTMKRRRTGDSRVVRNSLMKVAGDTIWDHGRVLAYAVTGDHVWVYGPAAAGACYYQR